MVRPKKQTADYFPHYIAQGKTMFILECKYGNDGYAFWFKLLEMLCGTDGHCLHVVTAADMAFLTAKTRVKEETATEILDLLADINAIDIVLWKEHSMVWVQKLVDNFGDMYRKRTCDTPAKPCLNQPKPQASGQTTAVNKQKGGGNPQSKVEESKVNKSRGNNRKENTTTLLGHTVEETWFNDLAKEYGELDLRAEEKRCFDWWTGQRKTIKNAKTAMRNWCINERRFKAEKGPKVLPGKERLREEWGNGD